MKKFHKISGLSLHLCEAGVNKMLILSMGVLIVSDKQLKIAKNFLLLGGIQYLRLPTSMSFMLSQEEEEKKEKLG